MASMRSAFRAFVLAVLVLALPAHGYAAAAMIACGMRHAQPSPAAQHVPTAPDAPCHGDGPVQGPGTPCDACSACAASSAPAIAPAPSFSPTVTESSPPVPFIARRAALHIPDGPERPPRTASR